MEPSPFTRWLETADEDLSVSLVEELLNPIEDDLWVCAACVDRVLDDVDTQRALLELGIARSKNSAENAKEAFGQLLEDGEEEEESGPSQMTSGTRLSRLESYFRDYNNVAQICQLRTVLLDRLDRLNTYAEITESMVSVGVGIDDEGEVDEAWEDDPWADGDAVSVTKSKSSQRKPSPPLPLSIFLTQHPILMCLSLASQLQIPSLKAVMYRHWHQVFPFRFEILDSIPLYEDPSEFYDILPGLDLKTEKELDRPHTPWRTSQDWVESEEVKMALVRLGLTEGVISDDDTLGLSLSLKDRPLSGEDTTAWYKDRVERIVSSTGNADAALGLVQHGISFGLLGLDELGEDLTLVSRLVYDAPNPLERQSVSISEWRSLDPQSVIRLYLSQSSPETVVADIRRLVSPYLFVLELRSERTGKSDPELAKRLLYDYVMEAELQMVASIFEESKPTMVTSQRLISSDEDLARLALACLYGSSSIDEWANMSRIFECLPEWGYPDEDDEEEDEADTTAASLSAFLAPSTSHPPPSASDLFLFFWPLQARSLSKALDILDVHIESGETLARWGVPVPLRWFLQSAHDETQQRAWATKMTHQINAPTGDLDSEDIWLSLLEDMLKLSKSGERDTDFAFGALSNNEIKRIFFRGLLSTGRFTIAKHILHSHNGRGLLADDELESICLDCSREFYDNASSGNHNFGDMKMARECLSVAKHSPAIQKEREFIEATSRICSFNVMARPGVPITPLEIRLTKDKLGLVSRVLSSNESAYKHTEVLLDLTHKLGFRGDVLAEVKTLAMIADTALQAEDFERAFEISEHMVKAVLRMRQSSPLGADNPQVAEAVEVCWVACFQLGRQSEAEDVDKKMALLGRALELCPPDRIVDILTHWRKLEEEDIERRREKDAERATRNKRAAKKSNGAGGRAMTLASKLQNLHMPSPSLPSAPDAAALASHAFNRVAASFPFSMHGRRSEESRSRSRDRTEQRAGSPDVQSQARHALQRGIGWLIGAEEDEL